MQDNMLGQNIIITERCRSLRQLGRNALRGKWKNAILAVIIAVIVIDLPRLIFDSLFGTNMANYFTQEGYTYNMDPEAFQQLYNSMPQSSILSSVWSLLITGPMMLGIMIYFLASFRGHDVVPRDVFLGFERFGKALGLILYQALFIFLWTLLFIVPGIIAAIRYSQAFYVMADDPNKTIRQCMDESKYMMKGNKMKYFLLFLSFIGWSILGGVPGGLLQSIVNQLNASTAVAIAVTMIATLFMAPVYAYIYSTFAGFYEILAGHLIKETQPMPVTPDQIEINAPVEAIEEVIEEVVESTQPDQIATPGSVADPANAAEPPHADAQQQADIPDAQILPEPLEEEDRYHD